MKTNLDWMKVAGAAFFEVIWVIGLKHASTAWEWIVTVIAMLISFYVIISAGKKLPVGTVYSVFVGLGTAGTMIAEIIVFEKPIRVIELLLMIVLLTGAVGLKKVTPSKEAEEVS